ncbi:nucleoside-diphosphate sugar epimerase [Ottowia sp.]|jgi:uncharacterized protein YbjT (DUF2867 family)|uniref:nucleoside-diphosphate sugar epimerase n=1 Tax=Ottowia sp. TaxID=1898956 RepID=UPI0025EB1037|nr:nucleoside-diphosphate sugar epimerase [Ottowia sp.]MBK6614837.1 NAD(P)H-binding protein [Ottowia sp.]MBK6745920.1 NAD(P)H-binding protein [Ottowia sp.]
MANAAAPSPPARHVAVAGASGLVGRCLVARLCADPSVAQVHALVRRALPLTHAKLRTHGVDFAALPALPAIDEVYLALGTTIKVAGSQAAFRAVDFDANLAVAQAARAAGARRCGLVSALGASARSAVFYSRVKGELEDALAALPFEALVIARPAMLRGDRQALGQPVRSGEVLWGGFDDALRLFIPRGLRAIAADDVAAALVRAVPAARGREVLDSSAMQGAAAIS